MGEFGDTVLKHYRARDNKEDASDSDSKLRRNGSEIGKDKAVLPLDVPDALRSTREALDLVVACMVALLLVILVLTILATIVTTTVPTLLPSSYPTPHSHSTSPRITTITVAP